MHEPVTRDRMSRVAENFRIRGRLTDFGPYGSGHINDTLLAMFTGGETADPRKFIFQRINHLVFPDVEGLMDNISRVTGHLQSKLEGIPGAEPDRETLTLVPTVDGKAYLTTEDGECWRCYLFIEGASTHDVIIDPDQACEAGRAFGAFQKTLADLPPPELNETIPDFHHTPKRFETLMEAVRADSHGRAERCSEEIDFVKSLEEVLPTVTEGLRSGEIPLRTTHNDTKINNVMLDDRTGEAVCVIDLDTVMPGSVLYDFGDQVRTSTGHFQENEKNLDRVFIDLERFSCLVRGYLEESSGFLKDRELELLPFSGLLITLTIGIRFLTDFLQGDVYFNTSYPGENLDRCRSQFAMVRSVQQHESEMLDIVDEFR